MKKVAVDSSSVILLQKADLLESLLGNYESVVHPIVYDELTIAGKFEADFFRRRLADNIHPGARSLAEIKLGAGEKGAIELYLSGKSNFILLDDRRAANYCKKLALPFINSLLLCRIFFLAGILDENQFVEARSVLLEVGYYSVRVRNVAATLPGQRLREFFP